MDNHISDTCRFCLDGIEEFNHLLFDCPAPSTLRTVNTQDSEHSSPPQWTLQQILDFSLFPKVNKAFVKPLFLIKGPMYTEPQSQNAITPIDSDSEASIMEISSLSASSFEDNSDDSLISIE